MKVLTKDKEILTFDKMIKDEVVYSILEKGCGKSFMEPQTLYKIRIGADLNVNDLLEIGCVLESVYIVFSSKLYPDFKGKNKVIALLKNMLKLTKDQIKKVETLK